MAKAAMNIDLNAWFEEARSQFVGLDPKEPGQWPILPKLLAFASAVLVVLIAGWLLVLSDQSDELQAARDAEPRLKEEYRSKVAKAVNLNELRKQRIQVEEYVKQLEKQLPGKAEMDALLSDINQAGLGRGLEFELFKPGAVSVKDYYAELPIAIRVTGRFHDIGAFTADIANLSRIVTLHDIVIGGINPGNGKDAPTGDLFMEATARTYRYLDPSELQDVRKHKADDAKKNGKGARQEGRP